MAKATTSLLGRRFLASLREPALSTTFWSSRGSTVACFGACHSSTFLQNRPSRRTIHSEHPSSHSANAHTPTPKRSLTGTGLLLIGFTTHASPSSSQPAATAAESASGTPPPKGRNIHRLARLAWQRSIHTNSKDPQRHDAENKRPTPWQETKGEPAAPPQQRDASKPQPPPGQPASPPSEHEESIASTVSKYLHIPKMPHRPTREELLAAATGFWQRMKVRFKWASIRSMRPWNIDEWGAFVSWVLFGHLLWVLVGTTTFFSLLILSINTVFAQGMSTVLP